MEFELTPEQRRVQSLARQFAEQEVAPLARQADERGKIPYDLIRRMGELGFLAAPLTKRYGGADMDFVSYVLLCEELGRVDASLRSFLASHTGLISCVQAWGSEEQKLHYLPRFANGDWIGCCALFESGAGSDIASLATTATQDGDGYHLQGEKIWVANGHIAHFALVFASQERSPRQRSICAFLVPTDISGFQRAPMPGRDAGYRVFEHIRITLKQCRVSASALLGAVGDGVKMANSLLDRGRLDVAAGAIGVGQACLDACVSFARQDNQSGQRLADFEMIQAAIADMASEVQAARLLTLHAAWLTDHPDRAQPAGHAISLAKLFATEAAIQIASKAVLFPGHRGYDPAVERYYRDIKDLLIYESNTIQRISITRNLLGPDEKKRRKRK